MNPVPPFPAAAYPMQAVTGTDSTGWAVNLLGNNSWSVHPSQGTFDPAQGCMNSQEEFEGLQTVMASGPTQMLSCISYVAVSGPGAGEVDVAVYPATVSGATKFEGWQGTDFADGPAVAVNGIYWYRLHVEWDSPADDPSQDLSSVLYAKTYRHQGGGHAQPFQLWAFRFNIANLTTWVGSYTTDTTWWDGYFSPLEITVDDQVLLKGQPVLYRYDGASHTLSIPQQPWSGSSDGTFWGADATFTAAPTGPTFAGQLRPRQQDGYVGYAGTAKGVQQFRFTEAQLTEIAAAYAIDIDAASISALAAALPAFPPPANVRRVASVQELSMSWTVGAFLGGIAGAIVGGVLGIPGGPAGVAAFAGLGAATGANIGAGLTYSAAPNDVIAAIEMENTHGCCVDARGQSYPVGWIPWIADLKSWRNYDPTTIPGVGVLIGQRTTIDGKKQLIGRQLMTRAEEILQDRGGGGHYSWVFTPDQAIVYKWNSGPALTSKTYIRHSQLGGGQPIICAGEFDLTDGAFDVMIATINDASGHYKPDGGKCMGSVLDKLATLNIDTTNIKVAVAGGP
jgi:hypothetical protein